MKKMTSLLLALLMTIGMVFGLGVAGCAFLLLVLKKAAEKFGE